MGPFYHSDFVTKPWTSIKQEKYRLFWKFRKVPMNQLVSQSFCLEIICYYLEITFLLDIMFVLHFSPHDSFIKSPKNDFKNTKIQ